MKRENIRRILTIGLAVIISSCIAVDQGPPEETTPKDSAPPVAEEKFESSRKNSSEAVQPEVRQATSEIHRGTGTFIGIPKGISTSNEEGDITLNFESSPITEVVHSILGDILNLNYAIDEGVTGSVSMRTASPITRADLIPVLDRLLRMNGAAIVRSQDFYEVIPIADGVLSSLSTTVQYSADRGYQMLVVPLRYIGAKEMAKILEPVKSGQAVVQADEYRNLVVIAGTQSELFSLRDTISIFDVDQLQGMSVGIFPLQNVDAKIVQTELEQIFGDAADGPLAGMVRITMIDRLNALMIITPQQKYLSDAQAWISRLDQSENPHGFNMYVYYVQNGKAEKLAELLNQVMEEKRRTSSVVEEVRATGVPGSLPSSERERPGAANVDVRVSNIDAGNVSVIAYSETNSLLITSSPADYKEIVKAIEKLDVLPMQVLIEASIVEVTLGDQLEYGLQWFVDGSSGDYDTVAGLNIPASGNVSDEDALSGVLPDPVNFTWALFDSGETRAILNAMAGDSRLDVLSSPSLMVLDNHDAVIRVGDQVPIRTTETTNTSSSVPDGEGGVGSNITSEIEYRDTGVTLEVTPRVNAGGMVMLDITQRVDDVSETTTSGIDSPTILQRVITTSVAVQSGETIVLGGLIREGEETEESGIPFLKDIPVLGYLFKSESINKAKTELVVMITPSAVANPEEARTVTEEYRSKLKGVDFSSFK